MAASQLQGFIEKYGEAAGPKLYHALQSRAAYIGANSRRRKTIAGLTGIATAPKRVDRPAEANPTPLLVEAGAETDHSPAPLESLADASRAC